MRSSGLSGMLYSLAVRLILSPTLAEEGRGSIFTYGCAMTLYWSVGLPSVFPETRSMAVAVTV